MHVLTVQRQSDRVVLTIESDADVGGCPRCGVVAVGHGRRRRTVADAPCFGIPVRLVWLARLWRCREPACLVKVFTEQHELVPPRAKVTSRAAAWATDALTFDDTTVSALARHLGIDWHTCWDAVEAEATRRLADPARLDGVEVLGVDEHIWRPSRVGDKDRAVTGMVDLTRDANGQLHARLLDVVPGRTGTAYAGWLKEQSNTFTAGIKHASLDPFRGYANAIRMSSLTPSPCSTPSTSSSWGPRSSTKSAAESSRTPWPDAVTRTTRCTRSAGSYAAAGNTCPRSRPRS
jgi:transposase